MVFDPNTPSTSQNIGDIVASTRTNLAELFAMISEHVANQTDAHDIDTLLASAAAFASHALDTSSAHGVGYLAGRTTALESELGTARGTASTLGSRLNTGLEPSGAIKLSSLASKWLDNGDVPTFLGATSFSVTGDRSKVYVAGAICRFSVQEGYVYGACATASYVGGVTTVTLSPQYPVLDPTLAKVEISLLAFDTTLFAAVAALDAELTTLTARVAALEA